MYKPTKESSGSTYPEANKTTASGENGNARPKYPIFCFIYQVHGIDSWSETQHRPRE